MNRKNRSTRLRKKLRIGEFQEFGFSVEAKFKSINEEQMYAFYEQWIDFVIAQSWEFGGGCSVSGLSGFLTKPYRVSMTDNDIALTVKWLQSRAEVAAVSASELVDAWY